MEKEKKKKERVLRLAKRWRKGFFSILFSRLGLVLLLLGIQLLLLVSIWLLFDQWMSQYFIGGQTLFELVVLLYLFNTPMDPNAKLSWFLLIALMPLLGCTLLVWTQVEMGHRSIRHKLRILQKETASLLPQEEAALQQLRTVSPESEGLAHYLYKIGNYPVYTQTDTEYFPQGEDKFEKMLQELEKAKQFIFLEYFIIEEGYMWGRILEVLARKVKQGVEVRVMYDGSCEFSKLPADYPLRLARYGIASKVWEPLKPAVTSSYNYRDHRKILVIDGKTAFCGGVNLADEYINRTSPFGHWKDAALMLRGPAVDSFTILFLQMWNVTEKKREEYAPYLGHFPLPKYASGFVIPYGDCPLNGHKAAVRVYSQILYTAKHYVYIMTPYLIPDDELYTALRFASERGVDVKMILPGIPDKKLIWALSKRYYRRLAAAGVEVYEYTPGFVHSKVFVSDDEKAVVGTINLDYRSLYHHFECGTYLVNAPCINRIVSDFSDTLPKCRKVTMDTIRHEKISRKITGALLKLIAPLL